MYRLENDNSRTVNNSPKQVIPRSRNIKWLKYILDYLVNDSYCAAVNQNVRIDCLKNKMCRHTNDSYRLPKNYVDNKDQYTRINRLVSKNPTINTPKNIICRLENDNNYAVIKW